MRTTWRAMSKLCCQHRTILILQTKKGLRIQLSNLNWYWRPRHKKAAVMDLFLKHKKSEATKYKLISLMPVLNSRAFTDSKRLRLWQSCKKAGHCLPCPLPHARGKLLWHRTGVELWLTSHARLPITHPSLMGPFIWSSATRLGWRWKKPCHILSIRQRAHRTCLFASVTRREAVPAVPPPYVVLLWGFFCTTKKNPNHHTLRSFWISGVCP